MSANGYLTPGELELVNPALGWPGGYMTHRAARAWRAAVALIRALLGVTLTFNEAYRDYAKQVYYRQLYLSGRGNPAGIPGTSKHGTGEAVDIDYPMTSWSTTAQATFRAHEGALGWSSAQGAADGEPWHKVNVGEPSASVAGGGATPLPTIKRSKSMYLFWDTGGTGWLATDFGCVGLPSMQIYNLFYRVIKSDQSSSRPDTFNRAEVDMMSATLVGLARGAVGGPISIPTLDTTKLADAVVTALNAKGITATVAADDKALAKALDAGFVRSMTAYANAAAQATAGAVSFDPAKLANAVAQSLQATGVVTTVDTAAVEAAVAAAIARATAAIAKATAGAAA
jgi:hypothetical protein